MGKGRFVGPAVEGTVVLPFFLSLCFLAAMKLAASLTMHFHYNCCPATGTKQWRQTLMDWNLCN